jgi:integrase
VIFKRKKRYWMDDTIDRIRYRESLKTPNWKDAKEKERARLVEISQGRAGVRGAAAQASFNAAADAYIDERALHSAEKSCRTDRERSQPLRKVFGNLALKKITAQAVVDYQKARRATVSGRTVNLEVGLLRRVLKKNKAWVRIAEDIKMLPEQPKEARVLLLEEKERLLLVAKSKPEWQIAYNAAILALNTTCRSCELRGLRWRDVDWTDMNITIRRSSTKTNAGARVIPMNADALVVLMDLRDRAEKLRKREEERESGEKKPKCNPADEFVFPASEHGNFDASKQMKNWRTAWRSLTRAVTCPTCGTIQRPATTCKTKECQADLKGLKSPFEGLRFH